MSKLEIKTTLAQEMLICNTTGLKRSQLSDTTRALASNFSMSVAMVVDKISFICNTLPTGIIYKLCVLTLFDEFYNFAIITEGQVEVRVDIYRDKPVRKIRVEGNNIDQAVFYPHDYILTQLAGIEIPIFVCSNYGIFINDDGELYTEEL